MTNIAANMSGADGVIFRAEVNAILLYKWVIYTTTAVYRVT